MITAINVVISVNMQNTKSIEYVTSDCRSEDGITIGIIDGIITLARLGAIRDLSSPNIKSALKDLIQDEDLKYILNYLNNAL